MARAYNYTRELLPYQFESRPSREDDHIPVHGRIKQGTYQMIQGPYGQCGKC